MAFLDNSGDIILDAVLTDTGRYRLAKADGSFRIVKFALGDDEIDYSLYNSADSRGSAYYDIEILSTPVLEAFTDNMSGLKSKLMSIPRNNLLYLPVLKLNTKATNNQTPANSEAFYVAVDSDTEKKFDGHTQGVFAGVNKNFNTQIRIDQGLDTDAIPNTSAIDSDLRETQYIVEIDNKLGVIASPGGNNENASVSYIDDDGIASYFFTSDSDSEFLATAQPLNPGANNTYVIEGPRGSKLDMKIASTLQLQTSTYLFEQLGDEVQLTVDSVAHTFYFIDTTIKVTGATTGYRIDIPVRFLKWKSTP